jgi:hypothetical protein
MSGHPNPPTADISSVMSENLKGIALILLMWHHLFGAKFLDNWLSPFKDIEYVTGVSAKICLAIFLFCSGYGLYRSYINRPDKSMTYILKKIVSTLIPYWIIMVIAIIVLIILGKFEPLYIPINLFAWVHDDNVLYVSFSWYIKLHILLLAGLPLVRLVERKWKKNPVIDILIYVLIPFVIYYVFRYYKTEERITSIPQTLISSLLLVIFWFPLFAIGILFAKYNIYSKIRFFVDRFPAWVVITLSVFVCGSIFFLRYSLYYYCIADVIYAPLFIMSCLFIMDRLKSTTRIVLPFLGKKSLYYWLLSGMFFLNTQELIPIITWPQFPLCILLWSFVLLTPFVFMTDWVSNRILGLILREK